MKRIAILSVFTLTLYAADTSSDVLTIQPTGQIVIKGTAPSATPAVTDKEVDIGGGQVTASGVVTALNGAQVGTANPISHTCAATTRSYTPNTMTINGVLQNSLANVVAEGDLVSKNNVMAGGDLCSTGNIQANGDINTWGRFTANAGLSIASSPAIQGTAGGTTKTVPISTKAAPTYSILTTGSIGANSDVVAKGNILAEKTVYANGLTISGPASLKDVTASGTVTATGAMTANGGLAATTVTASGLITASAGLTLGAAQTLKTDTIAATTTTGTVAVSNGLTLAAGKTLKADTIAATTTTGTVAVSNGLTLAVGKTLKADTIAASTSGGATATGAVTASGLITAQSGLTVSSGDLNVSTGNVVAQNVPGKGCYLWKTRVAEKALLFSTTSQKVFSGIGHITDGLAYDLDTKMAAKYNNAYFSLGTNGEYTILKGGIYAVKIAGKIRYWGHPTVGNLRFLITRTPLGGSMEILAQSAGVSGREGHFHFESIDTTMIQISQNDKIAFRIMCDTWSTLGIRYSLSEAVMTLKSECED